MTTLRIVLAVLGVLLALIGPWWAALACIVILSIRFDAWEVVAIGLLVDFLWLPPSTVPWFSLCALSIVWLLAPVRAEFLTR